MLSKLVPVIVDHAVHMALVFRKQLSCMWANLSKQQTNFRPGEIAISSIQPIFDPLVFFRLDTNVPLNPFASLTVSFDLRGSCPMPTTVA